MYNMYGHHLLIAEYGNGKSLERAGSVTREVVLCSGLVDDGGTHRINRRRNMEPRFIIVS